MQLHSCASSTVRYPIGHDKLHSALQLRATQFQQEKRREILQNKLANDCRVGLGVFEDQELHGDLSKCKGWQVGGRLCVAASPETTPHPHMVIRTANDREVCMDSIRDEKGKWRQQRRLGGVTWVPKQNCASPSYTSISPRMICVPLEDKI